MMGSTEVKKNDWELSKENIQPLSSGRKMSFLSHSLDKLDEATIGKMEQEIEAQISEYSGPDPIDPWLKYIEFVEQVCPSGGKFNTKYETILSQCFQRFIRDPNYKEDRRLFEVYLKAIQHYAPGKRAEMIKCIMGRGFGTISKAYIAFAEALEAAQNYQEAVHILNKGINANAQPADYLQDALNNLQFRIAQRLADNFQREEESTLNRNFGAGVPVCKLTNEAQNIRVALSPSNPCRARPVQRKPDSKVAIFQGFADDENKPPRSVPLILPSQENEMLRNEKENIIKPNKWCNEVIPASHPVVPTGSSVKVEIYEDELENQPKQEELKRTIGKRVLAERKLSPEKPDITLQSAFEEQIPYRKHQLHLGRDHEITFEHIRAKQYMKKVGVTTIRALAPPNTNDNLGKFITCKLDMKRNRNALIQKTSTDTEDSSSLVKENKDLRKKLKNLENDMEDKMKFIEEQRSVIFQLETSLNNETSMKDNLVQERLKLLNRVQILEVELSRISEENQELKSILVAERKSVERLSMEKELLQRKFEEERRRLEQEFERERQESLLSFKIDQHRSVLQEEEKQTQMTLEITKDTSPVPFKSVVPVISNQPTAASKRMGFTLYESNMDMVEDEEDLPRNYSTRGHSVSEKSVSKADLDDEAIMPPPSIKLQVRVPEENKENVATDGSKSFKPIRPLTGVLLPSTTAEPMELIYDEDEEVVLKEPDVGDEFNVDDLTRALQLYPRPLVNSTPERVNHDETCNLPADMNLNRRRALGSTFAMHKNAVGNDDSHVMPLVYPDEEPFAGTQKEVSFANKPDGTICAPPEYLPPLSPIAEASKERWSSCTSSSSSANMTNTRGGVNFSSYNVTKSASRIVGRFPPGHRQGDAFQPPRSYTFEHHSQNHN